MIFLVCFFSEPHQIAANKSGKQNRDRARLEQRSDLRGEAWVGPAVAAGAPAGGRLPPKMRTDTGGSGVNLCNRRICIQMKNDRIFLFSATFNVNRIMPAISASPPPCTPFEEYSLLVKLGHLVCY